MRLFPTHLTIHRSSYATNFQHETPLDSTTHNLHGCTKTGKTIYRTHCLTNYHRQTHTLEKKKPSPISRKTDHSPKGNCSNQTISKVQIDVRKQTWNTGQRRNTPANYWRLVKLASLYPLFVAVDGCNELHADLMWTYLIVCVGTYCSGFHILQCVFLWLSHFAMCIFASSSNMSFLLYCKIEIVSHVQYFFCFVAVNIFCLMSA